MQTLKKTLLAMRRKSLSRTRPRRRPISAGSRLSYRMSGGPVSTAKLHAPGTLPFRLGPWYGFYDGENKWVEL